jgi:hypothetical protein
MSLKEFIDMGRRRLRFDVRKNCERKESCSLSVVQCCVSPPEQLLVPMPCNEVVLNLIDSCFGEVDLSVRIPVLCTRTCPDQWQIPAHCTNSYWVPSGWVCSIVSNTSLVLCKLTVLEEVGSA